MAFVVNQTNLLSLAAGGLHQAKRVQADWKIILGESAIDIRAGSLSPGQQCTLRLSCAWAQIGGDKVLLIVVSLSRCQSHQNAGHTRPCLSLQCVGLGFFDLDCLAALEHE